MMDPEKAEPADLQAASDLLLLRGCVLLSIGLSERHSRTAAQRHSGRAAATKAARTIGMPQPQPLSSMATSVVTVALHLTRLAWTL